MPKEHFNSREVLRNPFKGIHQSALFPELMLPNLIRWNWKMRNPLIGLWQLPPEQAKECVKYFKRVWTKAWGMKVLEKAAKECNGMIQWGGTNYQVIFATSNEKFTWLECPEEIKEIQFSFREHPTGAFVLVKPVKPGMEKGVTK